MYNKESCDRYYKKHKKRKLANNNKWRKNNPEKFKASRLRSIAKSIYKDAPDNIFLTEVI